ncbi:MAG: FAD-dependent oxidoreductase [Candidatus Berkiella sp.]
MKIAIVGAGVVGRLMAWHLCQAHEVHLFTKGGLRDLDSCSINAAGMISPYAELDLLTKHWHQAATQALTWWPKIISSLPKKVTYRSQGTLVVTSSSTRGLLSHYLNKIKQQLPLFETKELSSDDILQLEPELGHVVGCHLPEAQITPKSLFESLNAYFENQGVHFHPYHQVENIQANRVYSDKGELKFDKVIDCRGMGAKKSIPGLRGQRGELIHCYAPQIQLSHSIRVLHPRMPCYLVPWEAHHIAIGATQIESESLDAVSVRSTLELLSSASSVIAQLQEASIMSLQVGVRPVMRDAQPLIQNRENVITINGMHRHGFLLAPYITAFVANNWILNS